MACSNGSLQQRSRFGEELSPKSFAAPDSLGSALAAFIGGDDYGDACLGAVSATCVEYCPSSADLFLAGFSDGKLGCERGWLGLHPWYCGVPKFWTQ